jgi:Fe-S cluster assembly scaffold protein SufB
MSEKAQNWKSLPEDYRNILKGLGISKDDYNVGLSA